MCFTFIIFVSDCDKDTENRCDNGKCVPNYRWCNGHHDCGDYSDENHCGEC